MRKKENINKERINPKVLAMTGLIKTDDDTTDFKEYISKNKRLDYENIDNKIQKKEK